MIAGYCQQHRNHSPFGTGAGKQSGQLDQCVSSVSQLVALSGRDGSQQSVSDVGQNFGGWCGRAHDYCGDVMRRSSRCKRRVFLSPWRMENRRLEMIMKSSFSFQGETLRQSFN